MGTIHYFKTGAPITKPPIEFPQELYYLFGSAFLGYTGFRSLDKKKGGKGGWKDLLK